ncbi:hypothetical protein ASPZODRAFT_13978 [Penicilliopsis zonata CBS 506.65]|uniref:ML-like domain-containing protein n=1 Tax=Penicilliopsis zonata CBS 506.65 TaxID=1073090 RepID=A0A1L9SQ95_9EURO|nr:hypothetical protein ASPZODRAFT_13978 [Penicilliopsis zonata CBS 506.65]OJJ49253.1 hypothetical protein ASPZODRAFT_13978 [Penicilliopsis zonata CBS 506.65]
MAVMRLISLLTCLLVVCLSPLAAATKLIESKSLNLCMDSTNFTATYFSVTFTPNNDSLSFSFDGVSAISGNVTAELILTAYGYQVIKKTLDPCEMDLTGLCPMNAGQIDVTNAVLDVPSSVTKEIPSIAYTVPDLDASVRIYINSSDTGESIACVEADLSNGKTVYQKSVAWVTAVIAGLGLAASAITSGMGHSNTAAHVAANALSLFGFMQSQAMIGMTAIHMPPIVESWTQNFQWSMGIIHVDFMQSICTWYQRATGGTPSTILSSLSTTSVEVLKRRKRSFERAIGEGTVQVVKRYIDRLATRSDSGTGVATSDSVVIRGIERVSFRASIEETNAFLTGLIFFVVFVALVIIIVALAKAICESLAKSGKLKGDTFLDFRNGWKIVLRGILFRLTLIGYPQMCVLCLWELTRRDSAAEVVLAIVMFLSMTGALTWASLKVIRLANRSVAMHKNPAYILYSDPTCLNKWGFLYVQYRATAYYFVVPLLGYILIRGMFIGLSQQAPVVQAVALVVIEAGMLVAVSILRPWMDKKTNIYNISIAAVNFINVIFLLVFSGVFNQPGIVTGVMGVVFFVYNAVFALVLLVLVLIASIYAITSKNPDTRYQPMRDDRGSFIKSHGGLTTELDALGATARGGDLKPNPFDDEDGASFSSGNGASINRSHHDAGSHNMSNASVRNAPVSPVDPSVPLFPSDASSRRGNNNNSPAAGYGYNSVPEYQDYYGGHSQSASPAPRGQSWTTLGRLQESKTYKNVFTPDVHLPDLISIHTVPKLGIGQRAFLCRSRRTDEKGNTVSANILWDCITYLDEATVATIRVIEDTHGAFAGQDTRGDSKRRVLESAKIIVKAMGYLDHAVHPE